MDILVSFDHNYVIPVGIMLKSLLVNNPVTELRIHSIIDKNVDDNDKINLRKVIEPSEHASIFFYYFRHEFLDIYPGLEKTHFRESVYYRLFCSSILPANISKILYLDCDMIVNANLEELWDFDISNVAVGAVINASRNNNDFYFNNGVLLINLDFWRTNKVESAFVKFIHENAERIKWADQDVANGVLCNSKKALPLRYNVQESFLFKKEYLEESLGQQINNLNDAVLDPAIIHFTGSLKPWMIGCRNPYRSLFMKYKSKTPWFNVKISKESSMQLTKRIIRSGIKRFLIKVGMIEDLEDKKIVRILSREFQSNRL